MVLQTPVPVTENQLLEMKQDFVDVDFDKNGVMDAQEVRAHFKNTITSADFNAFFIETDADESGAVSLQEYVTYASHLL